MAHFEEIKSSIDAKVNTNGRQAISGHILNNILHRMLDAVDVALADEVKKIMGDVSVEFDTLKEIADYIATDKEQYAVVLEALNAINTSLTTKVDKTAFNLTIAELIQSIATKLDKTTYDRFVETTNRSLAQKLDKSVHEAYVSKTDKAISQKVDKTTYESELTELESAARCLNPNESNNVDLYIADEKGNSIAEFEDGHIRTQKFNSETDGQISVLNKQDADIEIADENGSVILQLKDGEVRTKNFDTKKTPKIAYDVVDDLDIADENGNIILRIKDGHLQTQRFDSSAQENNTLKGKKFSIIGDSISTYKGYVETTDGDGYRAFGSYQPGNANMPSVNDTWWMKFAKQTGMVLLKNCAWSGSLVCGDSSSTTTAAAGCSTKRVNDLARDGVTPDIVLIYMGINDMAYNKEVGTWNGSKAIPQDSTSMNIFSDAYALMVDKVMRTYPKAQVCCFTLLESLMFGNNSTFPTINDNKVALKAYNDVIKEVASSLGCNLIDLHACGINIHNLDDFTIDKLHPTYKGTTLMANKVSREIISKVQL